MKKKKIAYNSCFGGFGLSDEALRRLQELGIEVEEYKNPVMGQKLYLKNNIARHDRRLIKVIEELGDKVNAPYAAIEIAFIKDDRYYIDEYDGQESVVTPSSMGKEWIFV